MTTIQQQLDAAALCGFIAFEQGQYAESAEYAQKCIDLIESSDEITGVDRETLLFKLNVIKVNSLSHAEASDRAA